MDELLSVVVVGCFVFFFFKIKLPPHFLPPESEGTQIVFPYVHSDENAFLLLLSVKRTTGFFKVIFKDFFFPSGLFFMLD